MRSSIASILGACLLVAQSGAAWAQGARIAIGSSPGYAQRPLTLPQGRMRVDLGPPDFGYMDHGMLNSERGLGILVPSAGDAFVYLGVGVAFGILDDLEIGTLVLPLDLSPDFDFGDMEVYGRYAFLRGRYQLAAQVTMQLPTDTDFGFGFGLPALITLGNSMRFDTGAELEMIFGDDALVNLDMPAALSFQIADIAFIGARTGAFVEDFKELDINLGMQAGVTIESVVDLTASFEWPHFISTRSHVDAFNLDWFRILLGGTFYFDLYQA